MGIISHLLDFVLNCDLGMKKDELVHGSFFIRLMPSVLPSGHKGPKQFHLEKTMRVIDSLQITLLGSWVAL